MSAITLFFHVVYLTGITRNFAVFGRQFGPSWMPFRYGRGPQERNTLKWLEYSISATLGTVAVAYSDSCNPNVSVPPTEIVVFLIFVAITEQTTGYTWDSIDNFTASRNEPVSAGDGGPSFHHDGAVPGRRVLPCCGSTGPRTR